MEAILNVWPWYVAGPLMGLFVHFLLIVGNKLLGISSSFQHICSIMLNTKKFAASGYNPSANRWKFFFVIGITLGGLTAKIFLGAGDVSFLPQQYYSLKGLILLFTGGFLVGFGTRYANGCTAGHTISGISTFQLSGLIATISFLLIKYFKVKTLDKKEIVIDSKVLNKGTVIGGVMFGIGWAMTGACAGPIFAQIGVGEWAAISTLIGAVSGAYLYSVTKSSLPH